MDQEKFDQHLMDYLFDELDEVTRAAMKRKIEADAQCRDLEARLRATIEVGQLPMEQPSDDLEQRILEACDQAHKGEPLRAKVTRLLSWAGSKAMDPRLAMAAILVLVIGSAILLLPAKPGSVAVTPTKEPGPAPAEVEEGDSEPSEDARVAAADTASPAASAAAGDKRADASPEEVAALEKRYQDGVNNMKEGNFDEAQRDFNAVSQQRKHPRAADAALKEARAVRSKSGCRGAVPVYQRVRRDFPTVANDAAWDQADCEVELGNTGEARQIWSSLETDPEYGARAANELSRQGQAGTSGRNATASPRRAVAAKEPVPSGGGTSGKAKAAPAPAEVDATKRSSGF